MNMSNKNLELNGVRDLSLEKGPYLDVLSDVLRAIRLYASSYYCAEFSSPWGIDEPQAECGTFHVVIRGSAWLTVPEQTSPIFLSAGDIIAFPTGSPHQVSDQPDSQMMPGNEVLQRIRSNKSPFSDGQNVVTLLCGYFQYQTDTYLPLLRDMPSMLHIKTEEEPELAWLNHLIRTLAYESRSLLPGNAVVVDRLTEVLVIQLLRWHMNHQQNPLGYFQALADDKLSRALSLIHQQPSKLWTVEALGRSVSMSRTSFANRFQSIVGMTPLAYLSQWRMHIAYGLLAEGNESMLSIAEQVGYKSEASFGKAFKKIVGISPGKVPKK
ncbi:AraC family transcriptional regulator [Shewanella sp. D64]|uniref:AraC family transcriptional regulator n=1 Tax=unclassified Shewanella TaxID=196818 RepID=UPI0022BA4110|nr:MULTISPECIES: AraC family transcriptional regulator [unclassified Shewanella]MEC4724686.1 AraC family transcriptional regulator [Shewanella sp. D64]MEC4736520.1 AraC family transcriptional regulator [Shewanella sp. E94]WBJ97427.1 AraC family transcriptional regulator [Shewanella sp. MTB7]